MELLSEVRESIRHAAYTNIVSHGICCRLIFESFANIESARQSPQNVESPSQSSQYIESPSQIRPITKSSTHFLQNIESATMSLQDMESVQHTTVHDESTTAWPLNIQAITFFSSVWKQDPEQQHAKRSSPGVTKSKAIVTLLSDDRVPYDI